MDSFVCKNCGRNVSLDSLGTHNRNHCPFCLFSIHVDREKGDRQNDCLGLMRPAGKFYKEGGEEMLVHQCTKCDFVRWNRVAGDDSFEEIEKLHVVPDPRK